MGIHIRFCHTIKCHKLYAQNRAQRLVIIKNKNEYIYMGHNKDPNATTDDD